MWDLVGNPEDRFSHNEAHIERVSAVKGEEKLTVIFSSMFVVIFLCFLVRFEDSQDI